MPNHKVSANMKAKQNLPSASNATPSRAGKLPDFDVLPRAALIRERWLLQGLVPFSSATLWRRVRDGSFPAPIRLEGRITVWRVGDIRQWLASYQQPVKHRKVGGAK